jgi:hypothetical protein
MGRFDWMSPEEVEAKYNALEALNAELLEALRESRSAIESLPQDALGEGRDKDGRTWALRDELIDKMNKAIKKAEA